MIQSTPVWAERESRVEKFLESLERLISLGEAATEARMLVTTQIRSGHRVDETYVNELASRVYDNFVSRCEPAHGDTPQPAFSELPISVRMEFRTIAETAIAEVTCVTASRR